MTRSFFTVVSALTMGIALAPAFLEGCKATGVGDPCTPEQEYDPTFNGFDEAEVNVESKSFQCQTRLCLVNHFRGRVTCPYGQDSSGNAPSGASPCATPGSGGKELITGNPQDTKKLATVQAQCTDRIADKAVYCSCRCADVNGNTPSSEGNFCKCPDGFACTQLVTSIGQGDTGLTGAYCIKEKTAYDPTTACAAECDPTTQKCSGG